MCVGPDETPPQGWEQDPDVLDTWFSSALWPFSTMGWPDRTPELEKFYPTSVLVTGYDILFFWVARMVMFGTFVADDDAITCGGARGPQVPFENVFLHGLIRDEHGRKMSKSRGNGIDPLDWVELFGADALRFTLARGASPGGDLSIGEDHARASRNFATKLFNATRFALMNGAAPAPLPAAGPLTDADRWILGRAGRGSRRGRLGARRLRVQPGLRGALPLRLGRVLRLVPRAGQSPARRRCCATPRRCWPPCWTPCSSCCTR